MVFTALPLTTAAPAVSATKTSAASRKSADQTSDASPATDAKDAAYSLSPSLVSLLNPLFTSSSEPGGNAASMTESVLTASVNASFRKAGNAAHGVPTSKLDRVKGILDSYHSAMNSNQLTTARNIAATIAAEAKRLAG